MCSYEVIGEKLHKPKVQDPSRKLYISNDVKEIRFKNDIDASFEVNEISL